MSAGVEILYWDEAAAGGAVGNVFVSVTRVRQDVPKLQRVRQALERHYARWPGGAASLSVLESEAYSSMVTTEEREEIARMARDFHPRGVALVIEGGGFRPAAVRGLLAGVYLVSRVNYPRKIFESVGEGAAWVASTASAGCPGSATAPSLEMAVTRLRATVGTK